MRRTEKQKMPVTNKAGELSGFTQMSFNGPVSAEGKTLKEQQAVEIKLFCIKSFNLQKKYSSRIQL
jgi:hypothetical protein